MAKLVKIDDRKSMEIFSGRKTMGPIEMRLDEAVIGRLLRAVDAPKNIFALNPKNKVEKIVLTLDNYMIPEAELFGIKKAADDAEAKKVENAKNILEGLTTNADDNKKADVEPTVDTEETTETDETVDETEKDVTVDESKTDDLPVEPETVEAETTDDEAKADTVEDTETAADEPEVEDDKKADEKVDEKKEDKPKQYNNYNKNNNKNKNRK